jgi:feruloyl esterase
VLIAMVRWVEEGIALETITGTAFVNGNQSVGVAFKRNHFKWPARNEYQSSDPNSEDSWKCVFDTNSGF